jgi:hypothetical protein
MREGEKKSRNLALSLLKGEAPALDCVTVVARP